MKNNTNWNGAIKICLSVVNLVNEHKAVFIFGLDLVFFKWSATALLVPKLILSFIYLFSINVALYGFYISETLVENELIQANTGNKSFHELIVSSDISFSNLAFDEFAKIKK